MRSVVDTCLHLPFPRGAAFGWYRAGTRAEQGRDPAHAAEYYRAAWDLGRDQIVPKNRQTDLVDAYFAAEGRDWSDPLLSLCTARGDVDSLFLVAEDRCRRDLAGFMRRLTITPRDASLGKRIADVDWSYAVLQRTNADIDEVQQAVDLARGQRIPRLVASAGTEKEEVGRALHELESSGKNLAWLLSTNPVTQREVRAALTDSSALVEFVPTENAISMIVLRRDTVLLRTSSTHRSYLFSVITDYLQLMGELRLNVYGLRLSEPRALQRINELSSVLYNIMIAPVSGDLRDVRKLYVVLPEECSWLPVHTLRGGGVAVGQKFNVSYLPAASALTLTAPPEHWSNTVIGIGYPGTTGWDVEYELKDIRSFYDKSAMLFDTNATLRHLADTTYDVLHCAAEFSLDRNVPDNSTIILSDGVRTDAISKVPIGSMAGIPMPQALVFSNVGNRPGQLYRYVPALFLALGTRTVVATMWQGDRRAKKLFGEQFYTALLAGRTATEAYALAIREMSRNPDADHVQRWGLYYQYGR